MLRFAPDAAPLSPPVAEPCFAAPAADCLISVPLDGIVALYHRRSTMTHIVAEPVPEILAALAGAPLTTAGLLAALGLDDSPETRTSLLARLDELEASGLILRS